ncbi:MAG TPA: 3-oxoacyl-ACP reductase FabG, partial [Anaeromyxobacteraceae bacterium]|nr:3-oxoacyl-ACP reductase FabG [Anaeromyxobacteraceae bacterium]
AMTADARTGLPVAVVTGGTRGIGRAVVERLARAGLEVRFSFLKNEEAARALAASLEAEGHLARGRRVDARDAGASRALVDEVIAERGRLDVLVNNAGVTADKLFAVMKPEDWSGVLDTSLNGLFGATQPAARQMMRQRAGRIVNLTSVSGLSGIPGQANYCAAKAAIIGFTRSLSKELAGAGVQVNAVAPGFIDTDMTGALSQAQREAAVARVPMRRFGQAGEVAALVGWLALEAPPYLTGQVIVIDGGLTG